MKYKRLLFGAFILLFLNLQTVEADFVKCVTVEDENNVIGIAWVENTKLIKDKDLIIHYKIENNGNKLIYVVTKPTPHIETFANTVSIEEPTYIFFQNKNAKYNVSFHKVSPQKSFKGRYLIPFDKIKKPNIWNVRIGLDYIFDKEGLDKKDHEESDPIRIPTQLRSKVNTLKLGFLNVSTFMKR